MLRSGAARQAAVTVPTYPSPKTTTFTRPSLRDYAPRPRGRDQGCSKGTSAMPRADIGPMDQPAERPPPDGPHRRVPPPKPRVALTSGFGSPPLTPPTLTHASRTSIAAQPLRAVTSIPRLVAEIRADRSRSVAATRGRHGLERLLGRRVEHRAGTRRGRRPRHLGGVGGPVLGARAASSAQDHRGDRVDDRRRVRRLPRRAAT